ncbi:hypothetical protein [Candidatus Nitrosocosmicus arcticus]|uniref:Uncharacterized protein n=1 Tax=Candidatus Nitrosocosmicus arcticus TaxID=2035267 RepID=A0A557SU30_9ARCH|nr:hypothetical protein [Candidatus Nitrosocosmicus arcticus]TVP40109.1 hypothetical protein NARC_90014 [Candidatus Nitrosocosmicus arcticus]
MIYHLEIRDSIESGVLYSVVLPGCENIIGGRAVLLRNFETNIEKAFVQDVGIKMALGFNPRSTFEWKGPRPTARMGAMAILREHLLKAMKLQNLIDKNKISMS